MKPLTKEEFLDKKNANIHRELLEAFELKAQIGRVTYYMLNARRKYPEKLGCRVNQYPEKGRNLGVSMISLAFVIQVTEMIKSGELVFKEDIKRSWWRRLLNKES